MDRRRAEEYLEQLCAQGAPGVPRAVVGEDVVGYVCAAVGFLDDPDQQCVALEAVAACRPEASFVALWAVAVFKRHGSDTRVIERLCNMLDAVATRVHAVELGVLASLCAAVVDAMVAFNLVVGSEFVVQAASAAPQDALARGIAHTGAVQVACLRAALRLDCVADTVAEAALASMTRVDGAANALAARLLAKCERPVDVDAVALRRVLVDHAFDADAVIAAIKLLTTVPVSVEDVPSDEVLVAALRNKENREVQTAACVLLHRFGDDICAPDLVRKAVAFVINGLKLVAEVKGDVTPYVRLISTIAGFVYLVDVARLVPVLENASRQDAVVALWVLRAYDKFFDNGPVPSASMKYVWRCMCNYVRCSAYTFVEPPDLPRFLGIVTCFVKRGITEGYCFGHDFTIPLCYYWHNENVAKWYSLVCWAAEMCIDKDVCQKHFLGHDWAPVAMRVVLGDHDNNVKVTAMLLLRRLAFAAWPNDVLDIVSRHLPHLLTMFEGRPELAVQLAATLFNVTANPRTRYTQRTAPTQLLEPLERLKWLVAPNDEAKEWCCKAILDVQAWEKPRSCPVCRK